MKKVFKSLICMVLCFVMVFSCTTVAFAGNEVTPVILVHGLGANPVYENVGTANQKEIVNLGLGDTGSIVTGILSRKGIWSNLIKMMSEQEIDNDELIDSLADLAQGASVLNCDKNGNVKSGQGVINYWTDSLANHKEYYEDATVSESGIARQLVATVGAKNVYVFNYDWRQDICKTASDLNDYVKMVKANTGKSKVSLVGCSLGGSVVSAYLDAYRKDKDINRAVFVNPAFMGVDVARAYALDLKMDASALLDFIKCMETEFEVGSQKTLFRLLTAFGDKRLTCLANSLEKVIESKKDVEKLYNSALKVWIGNIPALWECIPYDSFDKAVNEMSRIGFLDKSSGLYTKIKKYHGVQGRLKANLKDAKKLGISVAVIADYGSHGIPITSKANNQTDVLIDTKYASAGATVASYGKKLNVKSGKYVSGDKIINAKTCALPDNTWFIKGAQHMRFKFGTDTARLVANLACGKVACNINAVEKKYGFGQFVKIDSSYNFTNV